MLCYLMGQLLRLIDAPKLLFAAPKFALGFLLPPQFIF